MSQNRTAYVVSAFTKNGTGGNKAGIVLESAGLTTQRKCEIAAQLGFSETVFLSASGKADWKLEYFTPTAQVPLCGHATIAAFVLLWSRGQLKKPDCTIETLAGILRIRVGEDGTVMMQQNLPDYREILPKGQLSCCNAEEIGGVPPIRIVSTGLRDILFPVKSEDALNGLQPDFAAMTELSRELDVVGVHAFALTDEPGIAAVCRNFAPLYGIDEESATGTSNCALACYLFRHVMQRSEYRFAQGRSMGAESEILVHLDTDGDTITGVFVGGKGVVEREVTV